ncbi:hypothetical protein [Nitrolancea hollandica]|uniref:hypothetical protein n=1 Tax=Nitrolancea hollandica TaxID=1206749 RepID=UPI00030CAA57|nr:hypothetical protein [Nitrolancea hollandica]
MKRNFLRFEQFAHGPRLLDIFFKFLLIQRIKPGKFSFRVVLGSYPYRRRRPFLAKTIDKVQGDTMRHYYIGPFWMAISTGRF